MKKDCVFVVGEVKPLLLVAEQDEAGMVEAVAEAVQRNSGTKTLMMKAMKKTMNTTTISFNRKVVRL